MLTAQYFESMNNVILNREKIFTTVNINNGQLTICFNFFNSMKKNSVTIFHNDRPVLEEIKDYTIHEFLCLCRGLRVKLDLQIKQSQRTGEYGC